MESEWLMTSSVARRLQISSDMVRHLERVGRLRAIRTASGVRLFARADVEQFIRNREARKENAPLTAA
jgi:excisionase family DNA binding protein